MNQLVSFLGSVAGLAWLYFLMKTAVEKPPRSRSAREWEILAEREYQMNQLKGKSSDSGSKSCN